MTGEFGSGQVAVTPGRNAVTESMEIRNALDEALEKVKASSGSVPFDILHSPHSSTSKHALTWFFTVRHSYYVCNWPHSFKHGISTVRNICSIQWSLLWQWSFLVLWVLSHKVDVNNPMIRRSQHWSESGHPQFLGILLDLGKWCMSVCI